MQSVNERDELAGARLLDYLDARTSWHRCLWNPGLVLSLREIPEASRAVKEGVLSDGALAFAMTSVLNLASTDLSFADRGERKALGDVLRVPMRAEGLHYHAVAKIADELESRYLERWASAVADAAVKPERIARAVASHLLDSGFNPDYLHRWWKFRLVHQSPRRPLTELIAEAHALATTPQKDFEVLVAFEQVPGAHFSQVPVLL